MRSAALSTDIKSGQEFLSQSLHELLRQTSNPLPHHLIILELLPDAFDALALAGQRARHAFDDLDELVKEFDIRVAIHNHGPTHRYNRAIDVLRVIEKRDVRIGACADLGHYIRSGQSGPEVIRILKGRLYGIHLKDFAEMKDRTKGVILGKGHLNVEAVFTELQQVDFPANGALSLEYEENEKNPIADIRECYAVAKPAMKIFAAN